jgi:hypothetical protein
VLSGFAKTFYSELDFYTHEDLVSKMFQAPSWGKVFEGTARKARKRSSESKLPDVGEEIGFQSC